MDNLSVFVYFILVACTWATPVKDGDLNLKSIFRTPRDFSKVNFDHFELLERNNFDEQDNAAAPTNETTEAGKERISNSVANAQVMLRIGGQNLHDCNNVLSQNPHSANENGLGSEPMPVYYPTEIQYPPQPQPQFQTQPQQVYYPYAQPPAYPAYSGCVCHPNYIPNYPPPAYPMVSTNPVPAEYTTPPEVLTAVGSPQGENFLGYTTGTALFDAMNPHPQMYLDNPVNPQPQMFFENSVNTQPQVYLENPVNQQPHVFLDNSMNPQPQVFLENMANPQQQFFLDNAINPQQFSLENSAQCHSQTQGVEQFDAATEIGGPQDGSENLAKPEDHQTIGTDNSRTGDESSCQHTTENKLHTSHPSALPSKLSYVEVNLADWEKSYLNTHKDNTPKLQDQVQQHTCEESEHALPEPVSCPFASDDHPSSTAEDVAAASGSDYAPCGSCNTDRDQSLPFGHRFTTDVDSLLGMADNSIKIREPPPVELGSEADCSPREIESFSITMPVQNQLAEGVHSLPSFQNENVEATNAGALPCEMHKDNFEGSEVMDTLVPTHFEHNPTAQDIYSHSIQHDFKSSSAAEYSNAIAEENYEEQVLQTQAMYEHSPVASSEVSYREHVPQSQAICETGPEQEYEGHVSPSEPISVGEQCVQATQSHQEMMYENNQTVDSPIAASEHVPESQVAYGTAPDQQYEEPMSVGKSCTHTIQSPQEMTYAHSPLVVHSPIAPQEVGYEEHIPEGQTAPLGEQYTNAIHTPESVQDMVHLYSPQTVHSPLDVQGIMYEDYSPPSQTISVGQQYSPIQSPQEVMYTHGSQVVHSPIAAQALSCEKHIPESPTSSVGEQCAPAIQASDAIQDAMYEHNSQLVHSPELSYEEPIPQSQPNLLNEQYARAVQSPGVIYDSPPIVHSPVVDQEIGYEDYAPQSQGIPVSGPCVHAINSPEAVQDMMYSQSSKLVQSPISAQEISYEDNIPQGEASSVGKQYSHAIELPGAAHEVLYAPRPQTGANSLVETCSGDIHHPDKPQVVQINSDYQQPSSPGTHLETDWPKTFTCNDLSHQPNLLHSEYSASKIVPSAHEISLPEPDFAHSEYSAHTDMQYSPDYNHDNSDMYMEGYKKSCGFGYYSDPVRTVVYKEPTIIRGFQTEEPVVNHDRYIEHDGIEPCDDFMERTRIIHPILSFIRRFKLPNSLNSDYQCPTIDDYDCSSRHKHHAPHLYKIVNEYDVIPRSDIKTLNVPDLVPTNRYLKIRTPIVEERPVCPTECLPLERAKNDFYNNGWSVWRSVPLEKKMLAHNCRPVYRYKDELSC